MTEMQHQLIRIRVYKHSTFILYRESKSSNKIRNQLVKLQWGHIKVQNHHKNHMQMMCESKFKILHIFTSYYTSWFN